MRRQGVWHCMDYGEIVGSRLVDEPWQYESLVDFGPCSKHEWIPTIELSFAQN